MKNNNNHTIEDMAGIDPETISKMAVDFYSASRLPDNTYDKTTLQYSFFINGKWRQLVNNNSLLTNERIRKFIHTNFIKELYSDEDKTIVFTRKPS